MSLSTIIQYSTIDFKFLEANIQQASKFSNEIIIPICDHLFNGEPENKELLNLSYEIMSKYPKCNAYEFEWQGFKENSGYYHNLSREIGTQISKGDWLLFIDADEIVDDGFNEWFNSINHTQNSYWLTCYWYFREPTYQATKTESAGLLVKKSDCAWNLDVREERQQLFNNHNFISGDHSLILYDNQPLVHHYSWVRNKDQMIKKVKNWGHRNDKNWISLIEEEFSRSFNGTDFVHGYNYNIVKNKFNIM